MEVVKTFTVRLGEEEAKKLEILKVQIGKNTDNGAIKHLLRGFESLNARYVNEINEKTKVQAELSELKQRAGMFIESFESLKKVVSKPAK